MFYRVDICFDLVIWLHISACITNAHSGILLLPEVDCLLYRKHVGREHQILVLKYLILKR